MYLNELLQKPILSLYEGEILGEINKIYWDKNKKKIKNFQIFNDENISYYLEPKSMYANGKHAITIKNKQCLILSLNIDETNLCALPFDAKVYSFQGEYLGIVKNYSITEKFYIEHLILDNNQIIDIHDVASCSSNSIVIYNNQEHLNISAFRYRIQHKSTIQKKVKTLPKIFTSLNKIAPNPSNIKENSIVGRICTKDIFDNNQKIIIKQNSTITEQILALASNKNKLHELMKYSKN